MVPSFYVQMFEERNILKLVEENLKDHPSLFVVDVKISSRGDSAKVKIILDGDNGISIEDCARLSRDISAILDSDESIQHPFLLEVTSPGIDHPLQLHRQYIKNIGRKVKVKLNDKSEKKGVLRKVEKEFIVIESEEKIKKKEKISVDQLVEIPFEQIEKTNVQVSFK